MAGLLIAANQTVSSVKSLVEMGKALLELRDGRITKEQAIEFNRIILATQQGALSSQAAHFSLIEEKGALEKEIAELKKWDTDKVRYELKEVYSGSFAYSVKPDAQGCEPFHCICATCYQHNKKSILQNSNQLKGRLQTYKCNLCNSEIYSQPFKPS